MLTNPYPIIHLNFRTNMPLCLGLSGDPFSVDIISCCLKYPLFLIIKACRIVPVTADIVQHRVPSVKINQVCYCENKKPMLPLQHSVNNKQGISPRLSFLLASVHQTDRPIETLYCIATQCTATFLRSIMLSRI